MKILILTSSDPDYGADYIYDGFRCLNAEVTEFPYKPSYHRTVQEEMNRTFDCEFSWTDHDIYRGKIATVPWEIVEAQLRDRYFDLIVVPTLRPPTEHWLQRWAHSGLLPLNKDRIVYCDGEDDGFDSMPRFMLYAGGQQPAAYFKRELPIGDKSFARPLPFGYPRYRTYWLAKGEGRAAKRQNKAIYAAHIWGLDSLRSGGGPGTHMRRRLANHLLKKWGEHSDVDVLTTGAAATMEWKLPMRKYHDLNRTYAVAISPAGAGYHTNRHFEIMADGCCPVYEKPWVQWPNAPIDGVHCRYFSDELECADIVAELLADPEGTAAMALAAQTLFVDHHTTEARAWQIWEAIYGSSR